MQLALTVAISAHGFAQSGLPEVQVSQLHVGDPASETIVEFTRMGRLELSFTEDDVVFLESNGGAYFNCALYNNVTNGVEWIVQNAHLSFPDVERMVGSHPGFEFGVGAESATGTPWDVTIHGYSLTAGPLSEPQYTFVGWDYPQLETDARGGFNGIPEGAPVYASIGAFKGSGSDDPRKYGRIAVPVTDVPAINEGPNECAPSAVARSIAYMAGVNGATLPQTPQAMKDALAFLMWTDPDFGTSDEDMYYGKCDYVEMAGLPICTQIVYGWDPSNVSAVAQLLNAGCDIEVLFGSAGIGHVAMLTAITYTDDGHALITTVDDANQFDNAPSNDEHVDAVEPDGSTNAGRKVDGFLVECWGEPCGC